MRIFGHTLNQQKRRAEQAHRVCLKVGVPRYTKLTTSKHQHHNHCSCRFISHSRAAGACDSNIISVVMILHHFSHSSCSWRVRLALHLKGLPFESRHVNLLRKEHASEAFLAFNPAGTVPVLEHGDLVLRQSLTIADYLDSAFPETRRLIPTTPAARAQALDLALGVVADTQPLQNLRALRRVNGAILSVGGSKEHAATAVQNWGAWVLRTGLASVEAHARQCRHRSAGQGAWYLVGSELSIAEVCVIPQLAAAGRYGIDASHEFPALAELAERVQQSEAAFAAARPEAYAHEA